MKKAHSEDRQMHAADTQDVDDPRTLIQRFCLFLQKAFFSQKHGL